MLKVPLLTCSRQPMRPPAGPDARPLAQGDPLDPRGEPLLRAWMPRRGCGGAPVLEVADLSAPLTLQVAHQRSHRNEHQQQHQQRRTQQQKQEEEPEEEKPQEPRCAARRKQSTPRTPPRRHLAPCTGTPYSAHPAPPHHACPAPCLPRRCETLRKEGNTSFESGKFAHAAQTYSAALKATPKASGPPLAPPAPPLTTPSSPLPAPPSHSSPRPLSPASDPYPPPRSGGARDALVR